MMWIDYLMMFALFPKLHTQSVEEAQDKASYTITQALTQLCKRIQLLAYKYDFQSIINI